MLLLRHVRYQHTTITYYMLCMLGTQTAELESHNVRGPSGSATHTGAIVLHADLGSKDRCRIAFSIFFSIFRATLRMPWNSIEVWNLFDIWNYIDLLFFLQSVFLRGHNSCFLAKALVFALFSVCHWVMFVSWRSCYSSTTTPAFCPLCVRFSNCGISGTVRFEAPLLRFDKRFIGYILWGSYEIYIAKSCLRSY